MFNLSLRRNIPKRKTSRDKNPIKEQVKKVLAAADQKLILMVRS